MANHHFEKTVTRFEFDNKCVLLCDDKNADFSKLLPNENLRVLSGGHQYDGFIKEFYVKGNFRTGIVFDDHGDGIHSFFFEQGVLVDRILKFDFDPANVVDGNRNILSIEVIMLTK